MPHHLETVGDEQVRQAEPLLQILEQVHDLGLDTDVEGRDRLVADDQFGLARQGTGDADPLALPARELVRIAVGVARVEADEREQLADPVRSPRLAFAQAVQSDRLTERIADAHARIQAGIGILEDHLDAASRPPQRLRIEHAEIFTTEEHRSARGFHQPQDGSPHRGLSAAAFPDKAQRFATSYGEAHAINGLDGADAALDEKTLGDRKVDREITDIEKRRFRWRAHGLTPSVALARCGSTPRSSASISNQHAALWSAPHVSQ